MSRFNGSLALELEFGEMTTTAPAPARFGPSGLRLAAATRELRGPEKYMWLEHRRRQAQIKARRLLDLEDE
jgi:hypothetical protein